MRHRILAAATIALTALGLFSCDMSPTAPHLSQLTLDVVSGNGQTGVVGTEVAPLIVIVRSNGNPVPLQVLNFRVLSGGGSVYGGTELTDNNGIAQEIWTLGTIASQPQRSSPAPARRRCSRRSRRRRSLIEPSLSLRWPATIKPRSRGAPSPSRLRFG
jgi:hypothetical protein